jgi:quinol monooxygenase YgiN
MLNVGLLVRLKAKPEMAAEVASVLTGAVELAKEEPGTGFWSAVQIGSDEFVIFDSHADDAGRQAHLQGKIAAALMANADRWLAQPPSIEHTTFLSSKLP